MLLQVWIVLLTLHIAGKIVTPMILHGLIQEIQELIQTILVQYRKSRVEKIITVLTELAFIEHIINGCLKKINQMELLVALKLYLATLIVMVKKLVPTLLQQHLAQKLVRVVYVKIVHLTVGFLTVDV